MDEEPPQGTTNAAAGPPPGAWPPPAPPVAGAGDRPAPIVALSVLVVVVAAIGLGAVVHLNGQIDRLEQQLQMTGVADGTAVSAGGFSDGSMFGTTTTLAPPIDVPPPDADVARREIVAAFTALFGESTAEQRQMLLTAPSELPDRLQSLAGGQCAGTVPIITALHFLDDDRAAVRFRFDGPTLPDIAKGYSFDGLAVRVDGRWLIDPAGPLSALDLGSSANVCGP